MVTSQDLEKIVEEVFNNRLSKGEEDNRESNGSIKKILDPSEFNFLCGIGFFSGSFLTNQDINTFLNKTEMNDKELWKLIKEYLGSKDEADYGLKITELKRIIVSILKRINKSLEKTNFQILKNNLTYKDYSKRFYGYVNALKVTKDSEDIEYNPKIVINKSQSLVDVEKVKAECYKEIEKNHYFKTNDDLFKKKEEKE